MNKNIKVAQALVRLAKELVSDDKFEKQNKTVAILKKNGFRYVSDFWTSDEFTIVMKKKLGNGLTLSGDVEEDGTVNGKSVADFLKEAK